LNRVLVIGAAAGVVALLGGGCAKASEHEAPSTAVFAIGKCFDPSQPAQQRPTRIAYNCDETGVLEQLTWTSWNADGADGTGTDNSVECQPNCAQGKRIVNRAVVHAWNPQRSSSTACPSGVEFYSDMTIAYPEGAPPWIKPGTTWAKGTDFVEVDGKPAVHFSNMVPNCAPR
jgi:hypothetical protein